MPAGDPAAYDPNVVKARLKRGEPAYQPRGKRGTVSLAKRRQTEAALESQSKQGRGYQSRRKRGLMP